jgi:purine-nucleoside phosphorylase
MVFSDHLNLQGHNPLVGVHEARWGERFVAMTHAYDVQLRQAAMRGARALGLRCFEGVYAAVLGPSFETPAEVRALRSLGADAVGMSTVPEVIAARQMGIRVLAIALITNRAAGQGRLSISHNEVLDAGKREAENLESLVGLLVSQIT